MGPHNTRRVCSVQFTFIRDSDKAQIRVRPGKMRDDFFPVPDYLVSGLSELVWEKDEEKIIKRFTRVGMGKYFAGNHLLDDNPPEKIGGIIPHEGLSDKLERFFQTHYPTIFKTDGTEYTCSK